MLTSGCGLFSPEEEPPTGPPLPPVYPILETPQKVLEALELAYEAIDSTKYKELYDSTYVGTSQDEKDTTPSTIVLTRDDEEAHIRNLAMTPGIRAYLNIGTQNNWFRLPSDDPSYPEWALLQIPGGNYNVQIADGNDVYEVNGQAATFLEFAFKPTLDDASPTDTLWKIVRWKEIISSS